MSASSTPIGGDAGENLPARLRRLRELSGMSRSELAQRTGFSRPTIWAWESGKTQPRHNNLQTLALALGISEVELVAGDASVAFARDEVGDLTPAAWQNGDIPAGLANPQRLRIMIYAAKLGIAALAGIKVQNVKISIEL